MHNFKLVDLMLHGVEEGEEAKLTESLEEAKRAFRVGDKVKILYASHIGEIVGFNEKLGGLYSGARYPVLVRITNSSMQRAVGKSFEYGIEQIKLIERGGENEDRSESVGTPA